MGIRVVISSHTEEMIEELVQSGGLKVPTTATVPVGRGGNWVRSGLNGSGLIGSTHNRVGSTRPKYLYGSKI